MKAFVTGGTGFIGSHLVDALLEDQRTSEVRCLVRSQERWLEGKPVTLIHGDLFSRQILAEAMQGVDVVIHNAAVLRGKTQRDLDIVNVEATESMVRIAHEMGVKKMIILSSQAASGPSLARPKREDDPMEPISMYGISKMKMENRIREVAPDSMQITFIRPPAVYGPREEQIYSYFKMAKFRISPIIGDGSSNRVSMVYVSDLVQGIVKAIDFRSNSVDSFFISGPELVTWNEIRQATDHALGSKSLAVKIPRSLVLRLGGLVEDISGLVGAYPVFNRDKANELSQQWICDHEKAIRVLEYQPQVSLEEGISRTIDWYRSHYWL